MAVDFSVIFGTKGTMLSIKKGKASIVLEIHQNIIFMLFIILEVH